MHVTETTKFVDSVKECPHMGVLGRVSETFFARAYKDAFLGRQWDAANSAADLVR